MIGSIYINKFEGDTNHLTLSPSASPRLLMDKGNVHGFAWQKTLDTLGVEHGYPDQSRGLYHVQGTVEIAKNNARKLESQIGVISRYAVEKLYGYPGLKQHLSKQIGQIATLYLPKLPEDYDFMNLIGTITFPFADDTNDDGVNIYYETSREEHSMYIKKRLEAERLISKFDLEHLENLEPASCKYLTQEEFGKVIEYKRKLVAKQKSDEMLYGPKYRANPAFINSKPDSPNGK